MSEFRSGFVAIVGRPNVGKSTLLNQCIGQKIAIMSDKPQTTRNRIRAIFTDSSGQIIFIDTPGIHKPRNKLGEQMMRSALNVLQEIDIVLFLLDATKAWGQGDDYALEQLKEIKRPVFLILNKIDLLKPEQLLSLIEQLKDRYLFQEIIPISALNGDGIDIVLKTVIKALPIGPHYYPEDQVTDHPERFIVRELIREKVMLKTEDEIPHTIAVEIEEMKERVNGVVYIRAAIYTERASQKAIIIGKKGLKLKEIGKLARADIELMLGTPVFIELWIKVKEDWRNQDFYLKSFGYHEEI